MSIGIFEEVKHKSIHYGEVCLLTKEKCSVEDLDSFALDSFTLELGDGSEFVLGFMDQAISTIEDEAGKVLVSISQQSLECCFDEINEISYDEITLEKLKGSKIISTNVYLEGEKEIEFEVLRAGIKNVDTGEKVMFL